MRKLSIFDKNGNLNEEKAMQVLKASKLYNPKKPKDLAFLQARALVRNCVKRNSFENTYACLKDNRIKFGYFNYYNYDPFLKSKNSLRAFVNDNLNVTECYRKTGFKLYYPSDVFVSNIYRGHMCKFFCKIQSMDD